MEKMELANKMLYRVVLSQAMQEEFRGFSYTAEFE